MSQYESNDDNGGYDDSRDDNSSDDYYKSIPVTGVKPTITGYSDNS
ncbi:hypothetical protein [Planktothrix agardhii]|nr:hypothetical protein [Planktothrix agardhii]MCB8778829.1 hypothetical protein [Planktothrix agardhii 1031]MCB8787264.1 hypothetical protein [Planktothrix agardhii 1025]MCF3613782.1 hypothetical protein [Planktothrix agardhii 1027]